MNLIKTIVFFLSISPIAYAHANINMHFNKIKHDPKALYNFLKGMPKGGELHYHLAGGPSAEIMLGIASHEHYCLDIQTLSVTKNSVPCKGIKVEDLTNHADLYSNIIKSWSMKDFIAGKESGHDHFFNGFSKYMPIVINNRPQLIANVMQRAADQHERYLELMDIPDNANASSFGQFINNKQTYTQKRQLLLKNKAFQTNITHTVLESDRVLKQARQKLGCTSNPKIDACQITVKLIYYSLREQSLNNLFAQTLNAFEAVSRSKGTLVGVNLVQPEDGLISLRDYHQQMLMFHYFHQKYPQVHISLHAGELTPEFSPHQELNYHIQDALLTGHAQRIGHGVDIIHESNAKETVEYMAKHHIPVEINLTSNLKILNITGKDHPLNYYLTHNVPVVLSTDDEGVLRTNLTSEYLKAVSVHHLDYKTIKQINRNTLTYAFIPGHSIWINAQKAEIVSECRDLNSKSCKQFIKNNQKAQLQWDLEQQLIIFERNNNR